MAKKRTRQTDDSLQPSRQKVEHTPQDEHTPNTTQNDRRIFLIRSTQVIAAACGLGAVVGGIQFAIPSTSGGPTLRPIIGGLSDFKMNTLTWIREHQLFITREEIGLGAFSSRCTHLGCTIQKTAEGFQCPCHGAVFSPSGDVVSGPARTPLPWYRIMLLSDGRLMVDLEQPVEQRHPTPLSTLAEEVI